MKNLGPAIEAPNSRKPSLRVRTPKNHAGIMVFRVQDLVFRVLGFRVQDSGF